MKLIRNSGNDRVIDALREVLKPDCAVDIASPAFSLFAFAEVQNLLDEVSSCRLILPTAQGTNLGLIGSEADRPFRNRLQARWLAGKCATWVKKKAEVRGASMSLPQSTLITSHKDPGLRRIITGNCPFTTDGLGITPGNQFSLIQCSESSEEWTLLGSWFTSVWESLPPSPEAQNVFLARLHHLIEQKAPSLLYVLIL